MRILGSFILFSSFVFTPSLAQKDTIRIELNGYINNLWSYNFIEDQLFSDYVLHNRLKLKIYSPQNINFVFDLRSRLFIGDQPKLLPNYSEFLNRTNDHFDLSIHTKDGEHALLHTMADRLYIEWLKGDWEIKMGRQRINWGISLAWNPHDLFNTFSFYDFDHIERPGSDAIRITKYFPNSRKGELAIKAADNLKTMTFALLYKWNHNNYDLQIISGKTEQDLVVGFGWAGNIYNSGFKGEMSYAYPLEAIDLKSIFIGSIGIDHAFQNNLYLNFSILFNSAGSDEFTNEQIFNVSNYRNLSPFKYSFLLQHNYIFQERYSLGLSTIFFPGKRNAFFISPSFQFSINDNWDIAILSQSYFDKILNKYTSVSNTLFLRLNYNF